MKQFIKSFYYAFNGIWILIKSERNAQIHLLALCLVIIAGIFFNISPYEWLAIILISAMVIVTEAINTAIETLSDFVSPSYNDSIKKVKDIAAGAVLLTAISAIIIGFIIFKPKILLLF